MMDNQEILDNAPEGEDSDVVDITGAYFDEHCNHLNSEGFWSELNITPESPRSLSDIKRIVELESILALVKKDLLMRAEEDSEGFKVVDLQTQAEKLKEQEW